MSLQESIEHTGCLSSKWDEYRDCPTPPEDSPMKSRRPLFAKACAAKATARHVPPKPKSVEILNCLHVAE